MFYRIFIIAVMALSAVESSAQAVNQCALIQCDCAAINQGTWRNSCETRERNIKARCNASGGERVSACTIAGASAWPLTLQTVSAERTPTFLLDEDPLDNWMDEANSQLDALNFQMASSRDWTIGKLQEASWSQAIVSAVAWRDQLRNEWWLTSNSLRGEAKLDEDPVDEDRVAELLPNVDARIAELRRLREAVNNPGAEAFALINVLSSMEIEQLQVKAQLLAMIAQYEPSAEVWQQVARRSEGLFRQSGLTPNEQRRAAIDAVAEHYQAATAFDRAGNQRAALVAFDRAEEIKANPMVLAE
ncbi:hypothetical protein [Umboniibacter marinipuniceus]|uniref:Uncharacterized protein n=1 Tax=Umboniibacter marinipuniceus TaxID=569599 RepID=A0A3M0AIF0_9GAMM|nr:hypothetical protein [Umboniibacter marinipuniceus]RMA78942.1 hypothetical protein DFR27_2283 [Umboniibacter marinipuniceus]